MSSRRPEAVPATPLDGLGLAIVAFGMAALMGRSLVGFTTDSDAYLDVAANLLAGQGLVQNVVDFWRPALPDPLGMWPPLYPALVAGVAAFGVPLEWAARGVAAAGFAAFAFAFHRLASRILGRALAALVVLLVVSTPSVLRLGAFAWSETTFLALVAAGLAILVSPAGASRPALTARAAALAGACLGAAAVTRYAGLAIIPVIALAIIAGRVPARSRLVFLAMAALPPGVWLLRNLALFGRPFGPTLPGTPLEPGTRLFEMARALRWELVPAALANSPLIAVSLTVLLGGGLLLALRAGGGARLAALCAVALLTVTLVATSVLAINAPTGRYLAPALPFILLAGVAGLAGPAAPHSSRRTLATAGVAMLALAGTVHFVGAASAPGTAAADRLERRADRVALASLLSGGAGPILSDRAHLARLVSGRPAVQIPPPEYRPRDYGAEDDRRWAAAGVDEAVMRGGAPPAGAWQRGVAAGRFTLWRRFQP